jgi:hypothetical protein
MAEPKGGLGYIGDNPKAIEDAETALERLSKALEARGNSFFDPQMLAMAEGFLAPTRSGSFGESLGNAANRLRLAQESQGKQEIESAQGNLAVIQQKAALEQQKRLGTEYKGLRQDMGLLPPQEGAPGQPPGQPSGQPPTGQPPAGQPTAGQPPAAGQPPNPMASMFNMEFDFSKPMPVDAAAILAKNEAAGIRPAVSKLDIQKAERENIKYQPGFVHDQNTGKLKLIPKYGESNVETYIPAFGDYPGGNLKVPTSTKAALEYAAQMGSPAYWDIAKLAINGPPKPPTPGPQAVGNGVVTAPVQPPMVTSLQAERLPPLEGVKNPVPMPAAQPAAAAPAAPPAASAAPPVPQRRKTIEEEKAAEEKRAMELRLEEDRRKAEQQARQARGEIRPAALEKQATEQEIKARQEIADNSKEANDTISFANQFRKYAELPGASKMFGILSNERISSGIAELVRTGVGVTGYTIGIPAIENVMRSANLTPAEQAQYRSFLQLTTQLQLQQAKYMKGPVSNYERTIVADAVIGPQDTPESIRMKADIMAARAQFDRQVAKRFKDSKQDAAAFLSSDQYLNEMIPAYHDRLTRLIGGETRLQSKPPSQPRTPAQGSTIPRADALAGIK